MITKPSFRHQWWGCRGLLNDGAGTIPNVIFPPFKFEKISPSESAAGSPVSVLPGCSLILQQNSDILYPKLSSSGSKLQLDCNCGDFSCQTVSWYRVVSGRNEMQYLGKVNQANRPTPGANISTTKFKFSMKSSSASTLTIFNLSKEDTGSYSCFLGGRRSDEVKWNSGVLLLPGGSYTESF